NNITLIDLFSGYSGYNALWAAYAAKTPGGTSFVINPDGSFPSGINPAAKIANLIQSAVSTVGSLTLKPCPGSERFASWLQSVSPAAYTGVALPASKEF